MTRLSDGKFGPSGKKLSELSDQELRAERARRRGEPATSATSDTPPTWTRVRQYLANLELSPGATWPEVERAYQRLRERYHPDKHTGHPERHETAKELSESLTKAYQALQEYFRR
jgi:DnaJ-domain-containing protein 1